MRRCVAASYIMCKSDGMVWAADSQSAGQGKAWDMVWQRKR